MYTGCISTLALLTCIACLAQNFDQPQTREEQCLLNFATDNLNLTSAKNQGLTSYQQIRELYDNLAKQQRKGYISLVEWCIRGLPSLAALIAASPSHSLFNKAIQANKEIYNLLSGVDPSKGSFTVFAPTDSAMRNENAVLDLRYHIVPKRLLTEHANPGRTYRTQSTPPFLSRDVLLAASPQVTTLSSGQTLSLSLAGQEITFNNQFSYKLDAWKGSDQQAWNGVLHSIDGILHPPTTTMAVRERRTSCFLEYCNNNPCLQQSLCDGECSSDLHASKCEQHWYTTGIKQGRNLESNSACVDLPDTTTTTHTTTTTTLPTIAELLRAQPNLKIFNTVFSDRDLAQLLAIAGDTPFTLFAPSDKAFRNFFNRDFGSKCVCSSRDGDASGSGSASCTSMYRSKPWCIIANQSYCADRVAQGRLPWSQIACEVVKPSYKFWVPRWEQTAGPLYHAVKGVVPSPEFSGSMLAATLKAFATVQYTREGSHLKINGIDIDVPGIKAAEGGLQILDSILTEYAVTTTTTMPTLSSIGSTTTASLENVARCFLNYCNNDNCLVTTFCDTKCTTATEASLCQQHWYDTGRHQQRQLDPELCSDIIASTTRRDKQTTRVTASITTTTISTEKDGGDAVGNRVDAGTEASAAGPVVGVLVVLFIAAGAAVLIFYLMKKRILPCNRKPSEPVTSQRPVSDGALDIFADCVDDSMMEGRNSHNGLMLVNLASKNKSQSQQQPAQSAGRHRRVSSNLEVFEDCVDDVDYEVFKDCVEENAEGEVMHPSGNAGSQLSQMASESAHVPLDYMDFKDCVETIEEGKIPDPSSKNDSRVSTVALASSASGDYEDFKDCVETNEEGKIPDPSSKNGSHVSLVVSASAMASGDYEVFKDCVETTEEGNIPDLSGNTGSQVSKVVSANAAGDNDSFTTYIEVDEDGKIRDSRGDIGSRVSTVALASSAEDYDSFTDCVDVDEDGKIRDSISDSIGEIGSRVSTMAVASSADDYDSFTDCVDENENEATVSAPSGVNSSATRRVLPANVLDDPVKHDHKDDQAQSDNEGKDAQNNNEEDEIQGEEYANADADPYTESDSEPSPAPNADLRKRPLRPLSAPASAHAGLPESESDTTVDEDSLSDVAACPEYKSKSSKRKASKRRKKMDDSEKLRSRSMNDAEEEAAASAKDVDAQRRKALKNIVL